VSVTVTLQVVLAPVAIDDGAQTTAVLVGSAPAAHTGVP
jgi:hypothetical protein